MKNADYYGAVGNEKHWKFCFQPLFKLWIKGFENITVMCVNWNIVSNEL